MPDLPSVLVIWSRIAGLPHYAGQEVLGMLGPDARGEPWAEHAAEIVAEGAGGILGPISVSIRRALGSLDGPALLRHHQQEPLVLWAFQPGRRRDGTARSLPPLTHDQFVAATRTWVDAGMPCPQKP